METPDIKSTKENIESAVKGETHFSIRTDAKDLTFSKGIIKDFYVCPKCGNVLDAVITATCPICSTSTKKFRKIN
jgi:rubrerythrin